MEFSHPPPDITKLQFNNLNNGIQPVVQCSHQFNTNFTNQQFNANTESNAIRYRSGLRAPFFRNFNAFHRGGHHPHGIMTQDDFDGKRLRKSVMRKTVDYNASIIKAIENRVWQRDDRDRRALQPESIYAPHLMPPSSYLENSSNAVTTRFVKTATNKMRCPIFTLAWTPEGRRLVTGASSGEFTLWNGLTFNFETILQAHDVPVRTMVWSHNDQWMVTGDHNGYVKYWQSNMNNVKMYQAHKEPIRGISFSPSDSKFVTCSDDGTVRVWDFLRCSEEKVLRGHGADVKCVHWHPHKALVVSGSKDNQQPIKLWDPKSGQALATLHAHKSTVMDLKWNDNGNWLITASRDHLLKLFDLRNLNEEVQVFRGHKKEASAVAWHPVHEGLFASGGSDGSILFWNVGTDKEVGNIELAHDSIVWCLDWHPLGHILCSGSNDHTIKFWTRNRPGDQMRDKYNLNTLPASLQGMDENDYDDNIIIPALGIDDKIEITDSLAIDRGVIPGLDLDTSHIIDRPIFKEKKPYSKPIPKNFQAQWNDVRMEEDSISIELRDILNHLMDPSSVLLRKIAPNAILLEGKILELKVGSKLDLAVQEGQEAFNKILTNAPFDDLRDGITMIEDDVPYSSRNVSQQSNKKTRFAEEAKTNCEPNSSNIPSLLQLNVNAPPDIEINLDDLKSDDDEDPRANGDNRSRKRGREDRAENVRDRSDGRPTRWNRF
ncbi:pre-mRNA 3' end processing protein WDR33 [Culicoides brevitarsis]|uniref:pre-mRNA 3' end processing protein WDR33 n=1 Tax=Culicoides brevitarsis TaxID=469753 RepID=UPI00307CA0FD